MNMNKLEQRDKFRRELHRKQVMIDRFKSIQKYQNMFKVNHLENPYHSQSSGSDMNAIQNLIVSHQQ